MTRGMTLSTQKGQTIDYLVSFLRKHFITKPPTNSRTILHTVTVQGTPTPATNGVVQESPTVCPRGGFG